ncbi:DUF4291 domain-containing protein [Neolewinella aurantiaca]|uniref:DUF4291 domain-containing protein n=2 Tax=Neolewinella aurantiaca TaxID=2602767 RepID=A0A5C7F9I2_9BACT|nr:DUF4291 domain-containing protein [Neolewinella aurantiaca]
MFDQIVKGGIPEFDYKPISRVFTWALADIGTNEARNYLEILAGGDDEIVAGFARKRLDSWEEELARKGRKIPETGYHNWRINIEPYANYQARVPASGRYILAYQAGDNVVLYQAYKPAIAGYAVEHQQFGGSAFSYNRMSWVKPNFLWMMYRCGWAEKENQERVLAIYISKKDWEEVLSQAVFSSYQADVYETETDWKARLSSSEVRLQWDPDHDPYGGKLERKAIQIGMKGAILHRFGTEMIQKIVDVTPFVTTQKLYVDRRDLANLEVPIETVYEAMNKDILPGIGLT